MSTLTINPRKLLSLAVGVMLINISLSSIEPLDSCEAQTSISWRRFTSVVTKQEHVAHPAAKYSLGNHGYTTGTFVINNQTSTCAFAALRENKADLGALLAGSEPVIKKLCERLLGTG